MKHTGKKGFTIIELMIVLAIVAIIVALALPSFRDVIRKSRRSDAFDAITNIQLLQERWRINHSTYGSITELDFVANQPTTNGHYTLAVSNTSATSYTVTATATGDQVNDACGNFTLTVTALGGLAKTAGGDDDRCWTK